MTLLSERANISTDYTPQHLEMQGDFNRDCTGQLRNQFAKDAVTRLFSWLDNDGKNNPGYFQSHAYLDSYNWLTTHGHEIQLDVADRESTMSYEHADYNRWQVAQLMDVPVVNENDHNEPIPEARMFTASRIAYDGILHIIKNSMDHHITQCSPEVELDASVGEINRDAIAAIGATVVRLRYFGEIMSDDNPDFVQSLSDVYRQNILSTIRQTAYLESMVNTPEQPLSAFGTAPLAA